MATTGYKRSLSVSVSKYENGMLMGGYPKTYPTTTDITNGYFTYNEVEYPIPSSGELAAMDQTTYDNLAISFKGYVSSIEGISFENDFTNENQEFDPGYCISTAAQTFYQKVVAWYDMEETSGTDMLDSSVNGLHGTSSEVTINQTSPHGKGYYFPGGVTESYCVTPDDDELTIQNSFAVAFWINAINTQNMDIVNKYKEFRVELINGGAVRMRIINDSSTNPGTLNSFGVNASGIGNETDTFVIINIIDLLNETYEVYINNELISHTLVTPSEATIKAPDNTTTNCYIGAWPGSSQRLTGTTGQVILFNDYLESYEVSSLWNSGSGMYFGDELPVLPTTTTTTTP